MAKVATIPLVLPDEGLYGASRRDQCADCVRRRLEGRPGIRRVAVAAGGGALELDYDPRLVTLAALEREVQNAKGCLDPNLAHLILRVDGMHSVDAERAIERALFGLPSVTAAASYSAGTLRLEFDRRQCPLPEIVRRLDRLGYRAAGGDSAGAGGVALALTRKVSVAGRLAVARQWAIGHAELTLVLIGGLLLVAGFLAGLKSTGGLDAWNVVRVSLIVLSVACTSTETWPEAWGMIKRLKLDVDILMFAAAIGAASLGKFEEGALLLFLFGLGSAGEHLALSRARSAISALTKLAPENATVVMPDGAQKVVRAAEVAEGDRVVIKPFEKVPVDGVVEDGASAVDQAAVTGESVPVEKTAGAEVFAGTLNTSGRLTVRCTKPASRSALARIIKLVEEAQSTKSRTQMFTDRVEHYYVPGVFVATALLIVLPPVLGWRTWGVGFYNAMAFLTAASPCALAIGTPAAVLCAIARAARIGVLIKGGIHLENLGTVRVVALDKTGTLTTGKLSVSDIRPAAGLTAELAREALPAAGATPGATPDTQLALLSLAAAVEANSNHPLALAVVGEAKARGVAVPHADDVEQLAASGVRGTVAGRRVFAGKPGEVRGDAAFARDVEAIKADGKAVVAVGVDGVAVGVIGLGDTVRPGAAEAVGRLHRLGVRHALMLTGDHRQSAERVAAATGLDEFHADLLPEDKLRLLEEASRKYGPVAMVGDGVNDAPALANAAVGIAMGGAGSDVAMETADVVLLSDDLSRLPSAIGLARRARRIIAQNLVIALGVIAVVAPLAALGYTRLSVAVLLHEGSTIVVVLNSLRLLRARDE